MKLEAKQRLKDDQETQHLERLYTWYEGGTGAEYNDSMLAALRWLYKKFGKPTQRAPKFLYAARTLPTTVVPKVVLNRPYKLKRSENPLVCFTTSPEKAKTFGRFMKKDLYDKSKSIMIVQVASSEVVPLTNYLWMLDCANLLAKDPTLSPTAKAKAMEFRAMMRSAYIRKEDELLCKAKRVYIGKVLGFV